MLHSAEIRASSAPYISGDTFRAFADFVIDETNLPFDPRMVKEGDVIFLWTDYLDRFFCELHPQIDAAYILITHNSDASAPGPYGIVLEDDKLLAWFAQNVETAHPKLHLIPIGIANQYWPHGNPEIFDQVREEVLPKEIFLYMNFAPSTYPQERARLYERFLHQPFCFFSSPKDLRSYLLDLAQSRFVLSPRGNGLDTHRTWESLYMGAIPVVRTSPLDPLYEGLPVVIIQRWGEVTEEFLERKWEEMQGKEYALEKLSAEYWLGLINAQRKDLPQR